MSLPGPPGTVLVLGLVGLAAACATLGEAVRRLGARWVPSWSRLEAIERGLLDFFLGGAVFYLIAAVPVGGFSLPVLAGVLATGGVGVVWAAVRRQRRAPISIRDVLSPIVRPAALLVLLTALLLLVFEVAIALPVGTGNTYDSSLLAYYTAHLLWAHQLGLTFAPSASIGILYPQGTTAWLGTAQLLLGLPGARTSLLLTPLFFALAPIGGFVLGRRLWGSDLGGLALALLLAGTASWTRVLVGGSNDFVFAFPLVLALAGQGIGWTRTLPTRGDAVAFGLLLGYSAALNPMGAEWLAPALVVMALVATPRFVGLPKRWLARWGTAVATALIPLAPTWYVLANGWTRPGSVPGAGSAPATWPGIGTPQWIGYVDPYLFRPTDVWLSPLPVLRAELAILLTVGLAILVLASRRMLGARTSQVVPFLVGGLGVSIGLLTIDWAGSRGGWVGGLSEVVSPSEASIWLFTLYAVVASVPLVLALEAIARPRAPFVSTTVTALHRPRRLRAEAGAILPLAVGLLIVLPGVALTPAQLPPVLSTLYSDFGNVTGADFDLLAYAGTHLPNGARVLVAPGSAGEFLPAYDPTAVVLFPMLPGWAHHNASYTVIVRELTNRTLDREGVLALDTLGVQYILVTQANTVLWPAFSAVPLRGTFPLLFSEGDASLFAFPRNGVA